MLVPRLLKSTIGVPLMLAAAFALLALSERPSPTFKATLAVLLLALATFVVIGAAGLPLLARYLLPAGAVLVILGAGVAATSPRRGLRIATIACVAIAIPGSVKGIAEAVDDSRTRRALQTDLRTLAPALHAACAPASVTTYRQVPVTAYATGLPTAAILPRPDGATIVLPLTARAAESLQSAGDNAPLLLAPPDGYALGARSRDWVLASSCRPSGASLPAPSSGS